MDCVSPLWGAGVENLPEETQLSDVDSSLKTPAASTFPWARRGVVRCMELATCSQTTKCQKKQSRFKANETKWRAGSHCEDCARQVLCFLSGEGPHAEVMVLITDTINRLEAEAS